MVYYSAVENPSLLNLPQSGIYVVMQGKGGYSISEPLPFTRDTLDYLGLRTTLNLGVEVRPHDPRVIVTYNGQYGINTSVRLAEWITPSLRVRNGTPIAYSQRNQVEPDSFLATIIRRGLYIGGARAPSRTVEASPPKRIEISPRGRVERTESIDQVVKVIVVPPNNGSATGEIINIPPARLKPDEGNGILSRLISLMPISQ